MIDSLVLFGHDEAIENPSDRSDRDFADSSSRQDNEIGARLPNATIRPRHARELALMQKSSEQWANDDNTDAACATSQDHASAFGDSDEGSLELRMLAFQEQEEQRNMRRSLTMPNRHIVLEEFCTETKYDTLYKHLATSGLPTEDKIGPHLAQRDSDFVQDASQFSFQLNSRKKVGDSCVANRSIWQNISAHPDFDDADIAEVPVFCKNTLARRVSPCFFHAGCFSGVDEISAAAGYEESRDMIEWEHTGQAFPVRKIELPRTCLKDAIRSNSGLEPTVLLNPIGNRLLGGHLI